MKTAVLVVDVQTLLCLGPWAVHEAEAVITRINAVTAAARAAGAPVVLVQHEGDEPMRRGTPGWQLDDRLEVQPADLRLGKTACDAFHETGLHDLLQANGVRELVVCGFQTEFCIDSTVRGALAHGYPVTLVADGHSTLDNAVLAAPQIVAHHNTTLAAIDSYGPRVRCVPAAELRFAAD